MPKVFPTRNELGAKLHRPVGSLTTIVIAIFPSALSVKGCGMCFGRKMKGGPGQTLQQHFKERFER